MLQKRLTNVLSWVYLIVLVLLPFHAWFTTWAGSNWGHLDAWRIWKEIVIFASIPFAAYVGWKNEAYRNWLKRSWLPRLIGLYILLYLVTGAFSWLAGLVNTSALIYGLFSNLRFLGFFLLVTAVAAQNPFLRRHAPRAILVAGAIVVSFGLLQVTVLPFDFLKHFGYGPDTIPAFQTVDNKIDYQRIQSTLRGANPLGAYLIVLISLLVAYWRLSLRPFSWRFIGYALAAMAVLFFSYSRSAYIGAVLAVGVIVFAALRSHRLRRYLIAGTCVVLLIAGGITYILRNNHTVENTLFHSDQTSQSLESSNASRAQALENGVHDVVHEPFGRGPGTAGPASTRNADHPARIAENYYLQIGQEVGWLGIALFAAINAYVGLFLWRSRRNWLGLAMLASLIGLSAVNMVSHAWGDDTLGLLWWGLLGIALMPAILEQKPNKQSHHEVQTQKKRKTRS